MFDTKRYNYAFQIGNKGKFHLPLNNEWIANSQANVIETRCGKTPPMQVSAKNSVRVSPSMSETDGCLRCAGPQLWLQFARQNEPTPLETAERKVKVAEHRVEWAEREWKDTLERVVISMRSKADDIERQASRIIARNNVDELVRETSQIVSDFLWMIPNTHVQDSIRYAVDMAEAKRWLAEAKAEHEQLLTAEATAAVLEMAGLQAAEEFRQAIRE